MNGHERIDFVEERLFIVEFSKQHGNNPGLPVIAMNDIGLPLQLFQGFQRPLGKQDEAAEVGSKLQQIWHQADAEVRQNLTVL
jgi:hypothetical protein